MYIDRILYPVETLGPGKRIAVWTAGCSKHCVQCANPELWDTCGKKETQVSDIAQIIMNICAENEVDGITFTGGDPLEQAEELLQLLRAIRPVLRDIMVYTGYTCDDLSAVLSSSSLEELRVLVSVLIDGPYVDELNDNLCSLRGSSNQKIWFFDESLKPLYKEYIAKGRQIQNFVMGDKFISVGIHNKIRK